MEFFVLIIFIAIVCLHQSNKAQFLEDYLKIEEEKLDIKKPILRAFF